MKTGMPKQRLSEKLNEDMERIRTENATLIDSQLKSFRSDLKTTAESALAIIKTDTEGYLLRVRKHLLRQSANKAHSEARAMIWPVLVACCLMISSSTATWSVLTWLTPSMGSVGVRKIERPEAIYLIPSNDNAVLTRCTLAGQTVNCLKISKD